MKDVVFTGDIFQGTNPEDWICTHPDCRKKGFNSHKADTYCRVTNNGLGCPFLNVSTAFADRKGGSVRQTRRERRRFPGE